MPWSGNICSPASPWAPWDPVGRGRTPSARDSIWSCAGTGSRSILSLGSAPLKPKPSTAKVNDPMFRTTLLATAAMIGGVAIGALAFRPDLVRAQSTNQQATTDTNTYEQLNLFGEVFERVRSSYVEPVKDDQLIESAINGMLSGLDPHSSYMNAKDYADMQIQTKGE